MLLGANFMLRKVGKKKSSVLQKSISFLLSTEKKVSVLAIYCNTILCV